MAKHDEKRRSTYRSTNSPIDTRVTRRNAQLAAKSAKTSESSAGLVTAQFQEPIAQITAVQKFEEAHGKFRAAARDLAIVTRAHINATSAFAAANAAVDWRSELLGVSQVGDTVESYNARNAKIRDRIEISRADLRASVGLTQAAADFDRANDEFDAGADLLLSTPAPSWRAFALKMKAMHHGLVDADYALATLMREACQLSGVPIEQATV